MPTVYLMSTEQRIHDVLTHILTMTFAPSFLDLVNESHMHSVPAGSETHFRLVLVSAKFVGLSRVARSRLVHEALAEQLKSGRRGGVHALAQRLYTPDEWAAMNESVDAASPPCLGGSKLERE